MVQNEKTKQISVVGHKNPNIWSPRIFSFSKRRISAKFEHLNTFTIFELTSGCDFVFWIRFKKEASFAYEWQYDPNSEMKIVYIIWDFSLKFLPYARVQTFSIGFDVTPYFNLLISEYRNLICYSHRWTRTHNQPESQPRKPRKFIQREMEKKNH